MKKLIFYLSLCTVPISASAADIFNSDGAFTIAKAVKLGRSATSLGGGLSDLTGQNNLSGHQSNACYVGYYSSDNGCQACSDAITGCVECESKTECTKCDINNLWDLFDNTCKKSVCSWNHNNTAYLATNCTDVDGYGRTSTIIVPNTNPTYDTVNIRFWDRASVSGGAFTTSVLRSTSHTSSQLETLSSVITFNNPVTVTDKVVLQEDSSDAASGVKMVFNGGLKGNPRCVVEKYVRTTGCQYASCSETTETDNTCTCVNNVCSIDTPSAPACDSSDRYFWNSNGSKTVPSGYKCIDGYGAYATISMPSGGDFNSVNIRFWNYATVNNSFTTTDLSSTYHTSSQLADLNAVITFNNPVTVKGTVTLAESSTSASGNRQGVKMVFNGGLKGNPVCKVKKQKSSSGCGYASCQADMDTDAVCTCTSSECVISDPIPQCAAGTFPNNGTCTGCAAGTYSDDGLSCQVCPDGTYSGNGAASCTACATGTYAAGTSNSDHYTCKPCSDLYTGAGSNTCTSCTTDGICLGSNSGSSSSSSSGSSSNCPRSPTGSKSAGSSCSTGSECSSGWCIPGTTVNPSYTGSGSLCGACS